MKQIQFDYSYGIKRSWAIDRISKENLYPIYTSPPPTSHALDLHHPDPLSRRKHPPTTNPTILSSTFLKDPTIPSAVGCDHRKNTGRERKRGGEEKAETAGVAVSGGSGDVGSTAGSSPTDGGNWTALRWSTVRRSGCNTARLCGRRKTPATTRRAVWLRLRRGRWRSARPLQRTEALRSLTTDETARMWSRCCWEKR